MVIRSPPLGNDGQRNVFAIIRVVNDAGGFIGVYGKLVSIAAAADRGQSVLVFAKGKAIRKLNLCAAYPYPKAKEESFMKFDPISGNLTGRGSPHQYRTPDTRNYEKVDVETYVEDGLVFPRKIFFRGKVYKVSSVLGSRKDPYTNFLEYGIIVNRKRTFIWLRPDGCWVLKLKHL